MYVFSYCVYLMYIQIVLMYTQVVILTLFSRRLPTTHQSTSPNRSQNRLSGLGPTAPDKVLAALFTTVSFMVQRFVQTYLWFDRGRNRLNEVGVR